MRKQWAVSGKQAACAILWTRSCPGSRTWLGMARQRGPDGLGSMRQMLGGWCRPVGCKAVKSLLLGQLGFSVLHLTKSLGPGRVS